ncbi:MFS transporter [Nonomuraea antimicrobica]
MKSSVPAEHLSSVLARLQFPQFAATLAGPLVGGSLFAVSPALPFVLDCVSYLVSALCSLALTRPPGGRAPVEAAATPLAGLRLVWRSALLRTVLLWSAATNAALGAVNVAVVVIAGRLGAGADDVGVMMSIGGCGGLIGVACSSYLAGRLSAPLIVRVVSWTVALVPLSFLLLGTTAAIGVALAVMFFALAVGNVVLGTRRIESTPRTCRAASRAPAISSRAPSPRRVPPSWGGRSTRRARRSRCRS